jgi:hypothetical protein
MIPATKLSSIFRSEILETIGGIQQICSQIFLGHENSLIYQLDFLGTIEDALTCFYT